MGIIQDMLKHALSAILIEKLINKYYKRCLKKLFKILDGSNNYISKMEF